MKPTEQTCDTERINDYLDERLSDSALIEFESHLSNCDGCQIEIQRRAAEPEVWRDVVELLGDRTCESSHHSNQPSSDDHRKQRALGVLDSLTPTDNPEMLGRVGDYEVIGVVGIGGMGAVLKGFDKSLQRVVAIKVMAPHLADSGSARTRFQREARAAAAITHDAVIDTYGVSEANGLPYLVMPFARGPSLQKRIDESGPLTALEVVRIGRQIASGLAAAHEQGLVHRDIKPANILLNEGIERLWITDFGVARAMDDASMTQTGVIAGTPQFMSPEQARGESVDQRSDLFSMGSVLYTACTGRPPFRSEAAYGILRRITDTDPRPIREINPDVPLWLCSIVERLMAKHPADRFQKASEVAELFEGCLAHLQQPAQVELPPCVAMPSSDDQQVSRTAETRLQPTPPAKTHPPRWQRRSVWVAASLAMLAAMGWAALQVTRPVDIAGRWTGEKWESVALSTVEEASGWYTGSFTDTEGRLGALQLEWSRLQRRYNGRWKVGEEQSGSVTLRPGSDELRGAVSIDSDSPVAEDMPRLREFAWHRADPATAKTDGTPRATTPTDSSMPIETPVDGRVVRWGDGIHENARVEKGDLIAEIADLDPDALGRREEQLSAAQHKLEAARILVLASEEKLESARTSVATLEMQRQSYTQVKRQIATAAEATVGSAKNKVVAEEAQLQEYLAALDQGEADYERQKQLFDDSAIPESQFREAQRKLKEAAARVSKAKAYVQAAENDVIARQSEEKAKEHRAQVDIDQATVLMVQAQGDVAKAESDLARAHLDLQKAEKEVLESEKRLARQDSQLISAPFTGFVTNLTKSSVLNKGDTICLIWPEAVSTQTQIRLDGTANANAAPAGVATSGLSGALEITETLGATTALGRRFRELRTNLREAEENGASQSSVAKLKEDLAAAQFERETAVAILKAQLDAAKKLNESQTGLRDRVKRQVESGDLSPYSLPPAEQALVTTAAEIRQLELLVEYYANLGEEKVTTPRDDRNTALAVLKVRLDAAKKKLSFQTDYSKLTRRRFEGGHGVVQDVLKAEQTEATLAAEVQKFEALLRYYEKFGTNEADQNGSSPPAADNDDALIQPGTDSE